MIGTSVVLLLVLLALICACFDRARVAIVLLCVAILLQLAPGRL